MKPSAPPCPVPAGANRPSPFGQPRAGVTMKARSLAPLLAGIFLLCAAACHHVAAQGSASGVVMALAYQPDSQLLVGGTLDYLNGMPRHNLGRLHADNTLDSGFVPTAQGWVYSVVVTWDEKILVGGFFPGTDAFPRFNLRRLNADGTPDPSFAVKARYMQSGDLQGVVAAVVIQPDGKVLVGGGFDKLAGQLRKSIGRLHPDGTADATFNPSAKGRFGPFISSMALQPDGKILVGGDFNWLGGRPCTNIGRLNADGTLDRSFRARANNVVRTVCLQPDGKVLLGGIFSRVNGRPRPFLARLFPNGDVDTAFNAFIEPPNARSSVNGPGIYTIGLQADGRIVIGGRFARVGGVQRKHLARVDAEGALDPGFNLPVSGVFSSDGPFAIAPGVYGLALQPGGGGVFGGYFTWVNDLFHQNIAWWPRLEPACIESLETDMSRQVITWNRCGDSPELESVIFDQSIDGINYVPLGSGTRIFGGWEIRDLTLPMGPVTIRARGRTWGGVANRSSGLVSIRAEL